MKLLQVGGGRSAATGIQRPYALVRRAFQTRAKRSPPMPVDMGSTTFNAAAAATAPSTALPPFISI